jgi:hypothetical protein
MKGYDEGGSCGKTKDSEKDNLIVLVEGTLIIKTSC